jgi:hypothetical protein
MNREIYTVTPNQGKWELRKGEQAVETFDRQDEAISRGREIARENEPSQLRIKGEDGSFRDEATYGDDPARYPS